jgi:hypothetical protein
MRSEIPTVVCTKNTVFWNAIWLQILRTLGRNITHLSSGFKVDAVCSAKECTFLLDCTWNSNQRLVVSQQDRATAAHTALQTVYVLIMFATSVTACLCNLPYPVRSAT